MPASVYKLLFLALFILPSYSWSATLNDQMTLCNSLASTYSTQYPTHSFTCESHDLTTFANAVAGTGTGLVYLKDTNNTPDSTSYGETNIINQFEYTYYFCQNGSINYVDSTCNNTTPPQQTPQLITCPDCAKDSTLVTSNQKLDTLNQTGQSIKQSTDLVTEKINSLTQGAKRNYGNYSMPTGSLDQSEPIAEIEAKKQEFTDLFDTVKAQLSGLLTPTLNGVAALPTYTIGTFFGVPVSIDFQEYHQIFDYFGAALLTIGAFLALVIILG